MARESHIPPFYFYLSLVLTQYSMSSYVRVPPSSPSRSFSSEACMVDITMMVYEIFAHPIVREYVPPYPSSEITFSAYSTYDLATHTGFLLPICLIDWTSILEDYTGGVSDEVEDPYKDVSDARETSEIKEDPSKDS